MHSAFNAFWSRVSIASALVAVLAGGCGSDDSECLAGSRICGGSEGHIVMLCTTSGQFEPERICPTSIGCAAGACTDQPPNFQFGQDATLDSGAPFSDVSSPVDTWPIDTSFEDSAVMDTWMPTPDTSEVPDPGPMTPDPGPTDTGPTDTGPTDLGPTDLGPTDTGVPDTGPQDTGPVDTGPPDIGPPDAGPPDTGPPDTGPVDAGPVLDPLGAFSYQKVPNIAVTGTLHAVRWHADGAFALLLGSGGTIARYEPGANLALENDLNATLNAIARRPDDGFLIVGVDDAPTIWSVATDGSGTGGAMLTITALDTPFIGDPVEIIPAGPELTWVIATRQKNGSSTINRVYVWHETKGVLGSRAYPQSGDPVSSYAGIWSVMMADPDLYAGSQAIITTEGLNGAGSHTWIVETDLLINNGWSGGYGNAGKAAWRPGGTFGMVMQAYGNSVYVFDGAWQKTTTPNTNNGAANNDIAWTADGRRAIIVARATGNPIYGTVAEYRAEDSVAFDPLRWVNQSIPDFDEAPWYGSFSTHLRGVDWRPGACAEGLIGASADSLSLVIRYHDVADPDCANL